MSAEGLQEALADQIQSQLCDLGTANPIVIENLQVVAIGPDPNPTPPSIDIYPGSPYTEAIGFGAVRQYWLTVRARVATPDDEAGKRLLLRMMDGSGDESVEAAIRSVKTYNGAQLGDIEGPTEYGAFRDTLGEEALLGCTWRVALIP